MRWAIIAMTGVPESRDVPKSPCDKKLPVHGLIQAQCVANGRQLLRRGRITCQNGRSIARCQAQNGKNNDSHHSHNGYGGT